MKALNLMLHTGSHTATREIVAQVATPAPTESWFPIPHFDLLSEVERSLNGVGLRVVNEAHGLAKDGNRYFGLLQVENGSSNPDYSTVIGLRNSHDKSFVAGLVVGSGVFVCDNLAFSGEIVLARKHTRYIERDLDQLVAAAVGGIGGLRATQDERIQAYKATTLALDFADHLILELLRKQVITATRVPDVIDQWETPAHPEFADDGFTAWRLFNAVTEVTKGSLGSAPRRGLALHGVFDGACGVGFRAH